MPPSKRKVVSKTKSASVKPVARKPSQASVDAYIAAAATPARPVLKKLRTLIKRAVPGATESINYGMPAFALPTSATATRKPTRFIYIAAFKQHIGVFPPLHGNAALVKKLAPFRNPKGNLAFPLDQPMPYPLIAAVAAALAEQYAQP
ncbi:MAG TPA: DUF1801 domain-containing protein [Kofleriaceae bacterium]|nr:DUF1801 domain-containing protein [Kofleriaceae bacterium]